MVIQLIVLRTNKRTPQSKQQLQQQQRLTNTVLISKAEYSSDLVVSYRFVYSHDVGLEAGVGALKEMKTTNYNLEALPRTWTLRTK